MARPRRYRGRVLLALLSVLLPSVPALTQASGAASLLAQRSRRRPTIDDRVRWLAKPLDLSEAQQAAVKQILERRQQQIWRIRRDPSISGAVRIDMFRTLQENTVEQIRVVLNEEQRKKYDPLAAHRLERGPPPSVEDWLNAIARPSP